MLKFTKEQLPELLKAIAESKDVFLPINKNGVTNFGFYKEGCNPDLETLKTVKSAKDAFFPQSEGLYAVTTEDGKMKISEEEYCNKDFVVFGVRPCDVRSFDVLDKVFLSDPVDTYYAARRAHGIIVSLACHQPEESCFCATFDIDAADPNADVAMWNIEGGYAWEVKTEKGQALTESIKAILEEAGYSLSDVVKTTVLLADIAEFGDMNGVYAEYFNEPFPARAAFQVAALPKGGRVEIEAVAVKK